MMTWEPFLQRVPVQSRRLMAARSIAFEEGTTYTCLVGL